MAMKHKIEFFGLSWAPITHVVTCFCIFMFFSFEMKTSWVQIMSSLEMLLHVMSAWKYYSKQPTIYEHKFSLVFVKWDAKTSSSNIYLGRSFSIILNSLCNRIAFFRHQYLLSLRVESVINTADLGQLVLACLWWQKYGISKFLCNLTTRSRI